MYRPSVAELSRFGALFYGGELNSLVQRLHPFRTIFCCDLKSDCLNQMQSGSISRKFLNDWSGRQDSNLLPHAPHALILVFFVVL